MSMKKADLRSEALWVLFGFSLFAFLLPFFLFINMKAPFHLYIYLFTVWLLVIGLLSLFSRRMK